MKSVLEKERFPYSIRYLSEEFILPTNILVYNNKVINVVWQEDPMVIVINSKQTADSYRQYFNLLWKIAKS